MNATLIESFAVGDLVPEWLFHLEPNAPGPTATMTFLIACHIIEMPDRYFICPEEDGTLVNIAGKVTATISASTKIVVISKSGVTFYPLGSGIGERVELD